MSVLYSKAKRVNPSEPKAALKWHIVLRRVKQKSEKEVAELLTKNTTLNRGEALMVLDELQSVILQLLMDGYSVQMGDWGSFQLTLSSSGTDTEDACTIDTIKSVNMRFRPGKEIRNALANITFVSR